MFAVNQADATRGSQPTNDPMPIISDPSQPSTTVGPLAEALALSSGSCWDSLTQIDRDECKNTGLLSPVCEHPLICKREGDTCGYSCENPETETTPCGDDGHIVWNYLLNPVSGDNPTENLKECDLIEEIIKESKFGFTCDSVNDQRGFINLPHIPKSQDYPFDNREIKILQADRYNDYLEAIDYSLNGIFQNSSCGTTVGDPLHTEGHVVFTGVFENDSCLAYSEEEIDDDGNLWDVKRVIVGYDDLIYETASGNNVILQHGQSWAFECRINLSSGPYILSSVTDGKPTVNNGTGPGISQLDFDMNFYSNNSFAEIIEAPLGDISSSDTEIPPFYVGINMKKYEDRWLHLEKCELLSDDGSFSDTIVENGCVTDRKVYNLQNVFNRTDPLMETLEIRPFKPVTMKDENGNFISTFNWIVKCSFTACENFNGICELNPACPGRYDAFKSSVEGRKRRSAEDTSLPTFTMEQKVEHPCAYASEDTSLCDGNGENCWTQSACDEYVRAISSSAVSTLSSALAVLLFLVK